jgi:hypothetical protein
VVVPKRCCPKFWVVSNALLVASRWPEVLKRNSNGTYDLDCKQNVQPEKLRKVRQHSVAPTWVLPGEINVFSWFSFFGSNFLRLEWGVNHVEPYPLGDRSG